MHTMLNEASSRAISRLYSRHNKEELPSIHPKCRKCCDQPSLVETDASYKNRLHLVEHTSYICEVEGKKAISLEHADFSRKQVRGAGWWLLMAGSLKIKLGGGGGRGGGNTP